MGVLAVLAEVVSPDELRLTQVALKRLLTSMSGQVTLEVDLLRETTTTYRASETEYKQLLTNHREKNT